MDNSMCIVMRTADYRDSDKMLTLFSRDAGRVSALARGAKNLKNPIAAASQPFCCGVFSFREKNGKLYVDQCEIRKEFFSLGSDFARYAAACAMMEAAERILENSVEYERLFVLLANCMYALEKGIPAKTVSAYYFVQLTELLGVRPLADTCAVCGDRISDPRYFCASEGGVVCCRCKGGLKVKKIGAGVMPAIQKMLTLPPRAVCCMRECDPEVAELMREYLAESAELHLKSACYL